MKKEHKKSEPKRSGKQHEKHEKHKEKEEMSHISEKRIKDYSVNKKKSRR